jgi:hypothetical protein
MAEKRPNKGIVEDGLRTGWSQKKREMLRAGLKLVPKNILEATYKMCLGSPQLTLGLLSGLIKHFTNLSDDFDDVVDDALAEVADYLNELFGKDGQGIKLDGKPTMATPIKDGTTIRQALATSPNQKKFLENLALYETDEATKKRILDYHDEKKVITGWIKTLSKFNEKGELWGPVSLTEEDKKLWDTYVSIIIPPEKSAKVIVLCELLKYPGISLTLNILEQSTKQPERDLRNAFISYAETLSERELQKTLSTLDCLDPEIQIKELRSIYQKNLGLRVKHTLRNGIFRAIEEWETPKPQEGDLNRRNRKPNFLQQMKDSITDGRCLVRNH